MAYIFLSHSSTDELEAVALKQWLLDNGWDDVFLDLDPERGLKAGERWQEALRRAADRCEAVVFIISPAWAKSRWCLTEFLLAKSLHKLIFGVVVKETALGELPTELTSEYQLCHLTGDGSTETIRFTHREARAEIAFLATGLNRLRLGLQTAGLNASFFLWPPQGDKSRAPYRGLEPLDTPDAAVFFGRDAEILEGLDKLRGMRSAGNEGLFIILGASGAGKSSFLRAGLLPRLARDDRHFYLLEVVRPERSPLFGELGLAQAISQANNLLRLKPVNIGEIKAMLNEGAERFGQLLANIQNAARNQLIGLPDDAPHPTLLLAVDQAEELFSADATEEARTFLKLIGSVLKATLPCSDGSDLSVIIAFTIRSDRYEFLQTAPELMGLKTVVFDALKPMPKVQFKEVITGPAIRASQSGRQLEVKPDLVQQLLDDGDQGGDTLPLLSLTLARLYREYGSDGDLNLAEYQAMGGMTNVIRTEIESILASDPETRKTQLDTLHAAFIPWLATINPDNDQPMRRLARMGDLPPASYTLVQALIEKRLLLSDVRDGEQVLEVAHESLLRQWEALAQWLREEREDLKEADRLEQAVAAWNRSGKKSDWLLEGERLGISEVLAAQPGYRRRLESAGEFLLCSRQRETQRKEEEERHRQAELDAAQEKQRAAQEKQAAAEALADEQSRATERAQVDSIRLKKRAKQLLSAAFGAVILAMAAGYGFLNAEIEKSRAQLAQRKAQLAQQESNSLRLVSDSVAMTNGARAGGDERAMLQLLAVRQIAPSNEVDAALLDTLVRKRHTRRIWTTDEVIATVAFSPDGAFIVSGGDDKVLRLWDSRNSQLLGVLQGHTGGVMSVAISPDGRLIASGSWDRTLRLWDARNSRLLSVLPGHEREVMSVAFSPDGSRIVSGSNDKTLRLWDASSGQPIGEPLRGHESGVSSVAFSPNGRLIASGSADSTLRLWDARNGQLLGVLQGHKGGVMSVAFSPDGKLIVSGSLDNSLQLWDWKTRQPIDAPIRGHEDGLTVVAFSPDGRLIASGSLDKTLRLWDAKSRQIIGAPLQGHAARVTGMAFSPDGASIVSVSFDKTLRLWNANSSQTISDSLQGSQEGSVNSVAFSTESRRIVSGNFDGTIHLQNASTGKLIIGTMTADRYSVLSVAFSHDGTLIASGSEDHKLRLWSSTNGQLLATMTQDLEVSSVAFSPDGTRIVSGGWDRYVWLWNEVTSNKPIGTKLYQHDGAVTSVAVSFDGTHIVSGGSDGSILLCDTSTNNVEPIGAPAHGHKGWVKSVSFSPDGRRIVSGGEDKMLRLWDAHSRQLIGEPMEGHEDVVTSVAFSPDGRRIISGGEDKMLRLWDAHSRQLIGEPMEGHEDVVTSVAFNSDGTRIVSGSKDKRLRLWDGHRGTPIGPSLQWHEAEITSVAFSPDGTRIVSASLDTTLRLWPGPSVWPDLLCAKLTRNMSHDEWRRRLPPDTEYKWQCRKLPITQDIKTQ